MYDRLKDLEKEQRYPFHMPGHKRNPDAGPLAGTMAIDITEIDGFDDLHYASGIIKEAQDRAAALYGSDECRFLVNGSTAGVLAAVSAATCGEDRPVIAAGRGSHVSLYHAAYLNNAVIDPLWERRILSRDVNIPGVVSPDDVKKLMEKAASAEGELPSAVFITSPNYYGVIADTGEITRIAHGYGVPVIVDAAHGAHFGFSGMPESAVQAGADVVIMSVHKTLPCLTQTALLHMQGDLIRGGLVDRFLRIYQTSSPSYVLMSSIESGLQMMADGNGLTDRLLSHRHAVMQCAGKLKHLTILPDSIAGDPCKIVISTKCASITGYELYRRLLEEYRLQPEMADTGNVVLIVTGMDTDQGIAALIKALIETDGSVSEDGTGSSQDEKTSADRYPLTDKVSRPRAAMSVREAWDAPSEQISIKEAEGRICADIVAPYPPGTPLLIPGEVIDSDMIDRISLLMDTTREFRGIDDRGRIRVVCEL